MPSSVDRPYGVKGPSVEILTPPCRVNILGVALLHRAIIKIARLRRLDRPDW